LERILSAAFRHPVTGDITTGPTHAHCWHGTENEIDALIATNPEAFWAGEGFLTDTGRFVGREEAQSIAKIVGQVSEEARNGLRAEEMSPGGG